MVISWLEMGLLAMAIALLIPITTLFIEVLIASWFNSTKLSEKILDKEISIAVLVPAHNEALGIAPVIKGIQNQLRTEDQVWVIADNCTDDTAEIARSLGVNVIERQDEQQRGKGYALDFGLSVLSQQPPDVVIMMDADCYVNSGSLLQLAAEAVANNCPTQAIYLFNSPDTSSTKSLISAFALKLKNWVRPLGLLQLGFPSLLFGTGMAFPWSVFSKVNLAHGHIVEDMKLGFDLSIVGFPPLFCPMVEVRGELPQTQSATVSQRTRWEHGHLKVLQEYVPRLFWQGIKQRRGDLWVQALDLSVPPLSLLVMLWLAAFLSTVLAYLMGVSPLPLLLLLTSGLLLFLSISMAWWRFARNDLSLGNLFSIIGYIFGKIPLYLKFLVKPQSQWVRTERSSASNTKSD